MDLDEYCESVKIGFPGISLKADRLYDKCWNQFVVMEFSSYSWFESLANAVNLEMVKTDPDHEVILLLQDISGAYKLGSSEIKSAIDVAFIENLYWQVPKERIILYWSILPENLRSLYVGFHSKPPL